MADVVVLGVVVVVWSDVMAMIDWVDRRLNNWARWMSVRGGGSGGLGYASVNWTGMASTSSADGPVIPVWSVEASETNEQISKLPSELRRTLEVYYLETESRARISIKLCCSVSTVDARLTRAHRLLAAAFDAIERDAMQHRQELARIAEAARP